MVTWSVYLLVNSVTKRTYIGATTNVERRLRQHNREIKGGARSTYSGAPYWKINCVLNGFQSRSEAYRWEKLLKLRGGKGPSNRLKAFLLVSRGTCPKHKKNAKEYEVPSNISYQAF